MTKKGREKRWIISVIIVLCILFVPLVLFSIQYRINNTLIKQWTLLTWNISWFEEYTSCSRRWSHRCTKHYYPIIKYDCWDWTREKKYFGMNMDSNSLSWSDIQIYCNPKSPENILVNNNDFKLPFWQSFWRYVYNNIPLYMWFIEILTVIFGWGVLLYMLIKGVLKKFKKKTL